MLANKQFIYEGQPSFLGKLFLSHYLLDSANESKPADADRSISPALGMQGRAWVCRQLNLGPGNLIPVPAICNIYKHFSVSQHLPWSRPELSLGRVHKHSRLSQGATQSTSLDYSNSVQGFVYARHSSKCFTLNTYGDSRKYMLLLSSFYRWRN